MFGYKFDWKKWNNAEDDDVLAIVIVFGLIFMAAIAVFVLSMAVSPLFFILFPIAGIYYLYARGYFVKN